MNEKKNVLSAALLLGLLLVLSNTVQARSWLSGRVINGQRIPESALVYYEGSDIMKSVGGAPEDFDITVSTYRKDITPEVKHYYEAIMNHFADAIWQMTQGAQRVRKVTFHPNTNKNVDVEIRRYGRANSQILIFEGSGTEATSSSAEVKEGVLYPDMIGYTLAHEFGHRRFGLKDEYRETKKDGKSDGQPQGKDYPVSPSVMNYQYAAASFDDDHWIYEACSPCADVPDLSLLKPYNAEKDFGISRVVNTNHPTVDEYNNGTYSGLGWLNFSLPNEAAVRSKNPGRYQDTMNTAQYRVHKMSCWETLLTAPGIFSGRKFYEDLALVAPIQHWKATITAGDIRLRDSVLWDGKNQKGLHKGKLKFYTLPLQKKTGSVNVIYYRDDENSASDSVEFSVDLDNPVPGTIHNSTGGTFFVKDDGGGQYSINPQGNAFDSLQMVIPAECDEARAVLEPDWSNIALVAPETQAQVYQIVIDRSGSMSGEKMEQAKVAAQLLVDRATLGTDYVGVVSFDDAIEVVAPLTLIDSETTRTAIKTSIGAIYARNMTAIGDAARIALSGLLNAANSGVTGIKVVFLLSDGMSNTGSYPLGIVPDYQNAAVPMFTFGFGGDADETTLKAMAEQTGGKYFFSPTTLGDIQSVFNIAFTLSTNMQTIAAGSLSINQNKGVSQLVQFVVDDSLGARIDVSVSGDVASGEAAISLIGPDNTVYTPKTVSSVGNETLYFFSVDAPMSGIWKIEVVTDVTATFTYNVAGLPDDAPFALELEVDTEVHYPAPLLVKAKIEKDLPVTGVSPTGTVTGPDGSVSNFELLDPLGTGDYTASINYSQDGQYTISVHFDNRQGTAIYTDAGIEDAPGDTRSPVNEDFDRYAEIQVRVFDYQDDDHGNTIASATSAEADNEEVLGRMDYSEDIDMFEVDVPEGFSEVVFRVRGINMSGQPVITLYDSEGGEIANSLGTETEKALLYSNDVTVTLPVAEENWGASLYAAISLGSDKDTGCAYVFNSGTRLATEKGIRVEVPNLVGLSKEDANAEITGAGLVAGLVTEAYSETVAKDIVMSQMPESRAIVNEEAPIEITVSLGPQPTVPDVLGMTETDARTAIEAADLVVGTITQEPDNDVDAGEVARQDPTGGSRLDIGGKVNLVISSGPEKGGCVKCGVGVRQDGWAGDIIFLGLTLFILLIASSRKRSESK